MTWTPSEAEQAAHEDDTAHVETLECLGCGALDDREVVDGRPEPCRYCDCEEWVRP